MDAIPAPVERQRYALVIVPSAGGGERARIPAGMPA
jgi:hypothetical protein